MAKLGVEPAKGDYKAKNILGEVITPDRKEWHPIKQEPKAKAAPNGGAAGPSSGADRQAGVGEMTKGKVKFPRAPLSLTALEDIWLRRATEVAIEKARSVVTGGAVPPNTPIGRLSDVEWGWIAAAVIFGWISVRAEQAVSNGVGREQYIRTTSLDPDPWDAGAIAAILPELAETSVDFTKPLAELTRDEMIGFLADAFSLIRKATVTRDRGSTLVTRRGPDVTATGGAGGCGRAADDAGRIQRSARRDLREPGRCSISIATTARINRVSIALNALIDASVVAEKTRGYLGASAIGHECMRRIQFDWMCDPEHPARLRDIFDRGHYFEQRSREHFTRAGFKFAPDDRLRFTALGGLLSGHADGIFLDGPKIRDIAYPCLWEHKAMNAKGWRSLDRDGLEKAYPQYAAQVCALPALPRRRREPGDLHRDQRRQLRARPPAGAVRRSEWRSVDHARRDGHRSDASRRAAAALH